MELQSFIGKDNDDLEKELGFTHYIELKDFLILKHEQEHVEVMSTLLKFAENQELKIVKTDNGKIVEIFNLHFDEIKSNLTLLEHKKGIFWEEETKMCFALLGQNFFSYVFPNSIMFSANEENAIKMAQLLDEHNLEYFGPEKISRLKEEKNANSENEKIKLRRNEPCHCASGKKYKKCCLDEGIKKYGKTIKI